MSEADAAELAARREQDAHRLASITGWKPLTLWYSMWAVLLGIGAISLVAHGSVGGFFVAAVLAFLSAKYAHYLFHGGRRRVWFVIW